MLRLGGRHCILPFVLAIFHVKNWRYTVEKLVKVNSDEPGVVLYMYPEFLLFLEFQNFESYSVFFIAL